ncbi:DEAD/DEAH box helicase [Amycolatopsis anabasis]|uniref:DEAD/DEAH box helicase n=1 Tax=Amycolatopsis anabasis TaxID=1840409 RepID=UPI00131D0CDF|nr:DEAD/DEAH box helicase [Amycolatopsis anabasis]
MRITTCTHAIYVPSDPPREGVLALWGGAEGGTRIELALPAGSSFRRTTVDARVLPLAEAIPRLLGPDARASPALAAWSAAVAAGVRLIDRGRLQPARAPGGGDGWRVGPLDSADETRLRELAAALPPEAQALPLSGLKRIRLHSPESLVRALWDATADFLVPARSAATLLLRVETRPDETFAVVFALRSAADPSLVLDAAEFAGTPRAVLGRFGGQPETQLLLGVRGAAGAWPPLERAARDPVPAELELDGDELVDLFVSGRRALEKAGIEVLWPRDLFASEVKSRASVQPPRSGAPPVFGMKDLLRFRWQLSVGGEVLDEREVAELAEAKRPIVRLRGQWVRVDRAVRLKARGSEHVLTTAEALAATLTGTLEVGGERVDFVPDDSLAGLAARLKTSTERAIEPAPDLRATLRPYQRTGLAWLATMTELGLGGCLADDMGLGKTIQLIALHLHRRALAAGPTLVLCPTSLLGNWERELTRFAPAVPVRRFHGDGRHLDGLAPDEVVLATYGVLRRDRALARVDWGLVAADEAQHAKNPRSATAAALRGVPSAARVALTGTPMENHLTELWSIVDWTTPGLLGSLDHFRRKVARPVERGGDPAVAERLAATVRPFLLRRKKTDPDIAPELPRKTETDRFVPLTTEQATLYEAVVRENLAMIRAAAGVQRRGQVLKMLTELKQICNHPAHFLKQDGPLKGRSGKLNAFDELLDVVLGAGESVLVFSQYVRLCRLLEARLAERGVTAALLSGATPPERREDLVRRFQAGETPVFLLSLKAGGVGLNLTRATQVIHYDRWWNPAVEDQATDRAYRIGQDRAVQVHRLIAEGTLEERIAGLLERKRDLTESVVGAGENWITELTDDELADLVRLGGDR